MQTLTTQQVDAVSGANQGELIGGFIGGVLGLAGGGLGSAVGAFIGAEIGGAVEDYGSVSSLSTEMSSPLYGMTE